jgi:hypothetical protein
LIGSIRISRVDAAVQEGRDVTAALEPGMVAGRPGAGGGGSGSLAPDGSAIHPSGGTATNLSRASMDTGGEIIRGPYRPTGGA